MALSYYDIETFSDFADRLAGQAIMCDGSRTLLLSMLITPTWYLLSQSCTSVPMSVDIDKAFSCIHKS